MTLRVEKVRGRRQMKQWLELPLALHAGDPVYTPPLKQDLERSLSPKNPLWHQGRGERDLLIAYRDGTPVGRVLAHVHHASNALHGERAGLFGLMECPDDLEIARALLDETAALHRARGLTELRGPYELTITQCIGAVVSGFDEPPSFSQSWNAPHLPRLLEQLGFEVAYRAATYRLDDLQGVDHAALIGPKQKAWLEDPKVRLRSWDMAHFDRDLRSATALLNATFKDNHGFVPLTDDEVGFMAGPMKRVVRPELTVFLEYGGEPVGVGMILPDFNVLFRKMRGDLFPLGWAQFLLGAKRLDIGVGQFIATKTELQNQGLMRVVSSELLRRMKEHGFRVLEGTWIGEANAKSRATVLGIGMREKHRLAVYRRAL